MKILAVSIVLVPSVLSCGAQIDDRSTAHDPSIGVTGGMSSTGSSQLGGGAMGTGGSPGLDAAYCDGLLISRDIDGYSHFDTDSGPIGCDIALSSSPPDASRVVVVIDCVPQVLVPWELADAGATQGFWIDYNPIPAHLILLGSSCEMLQSPGNHSLDVLTVGTVVF